MPKDQEAAVLDQQGHPAALMMHPLGESVANGLVSAHDMLLFQPFSGPGLFLGAKGAELQIAQADGLEVSGELDPVQV